jgi:hypothetical protein
MERLGAGEPLTGVRVNFSVALSCAAALLGGRLTHEELAPDWLAERDDDLRELATRVFLEHDWSLTAKTISAAGGSAADLPLRRLPAIRRRMQATGMDEVGLGLSDLRAAARHLVRRGDDANNGHLPRMTFPAHVSIRLRSGGVLESEGRERGASGAPLEEQQQVVAQKFDLVRDAAELPKAWRRRPAPIPAAS